MELKNYLQDGASMQARCVLAYLQDANIESHFPECEEKIQVGRWDNGIEQGYCIYLRLNHRQLNVAFFARPEIDEIVAIKWEAATPKTPTITDCVKSFNNSKVGYYCFYSGSMQIEEMGKNIIGWFRKFYNEVIV